MTCWRKRVQPGSSLLFEGEVRFYCRGHEMSSCCRAAERRWALMAHLPADDAIFALALAAWWQLRRSAYLLPHLRKGPASIGVHSDAGVRSWVRAITAVSTSITRQRTVPTRRSVADPGDDRPTAEVLDTVPMAVPSPPATAWDAWATAPDLVPAGRRQPLPRPRPSVTPPRHPSASIPRPRPGMDPPTYPSLAVGQAARAAIRPTPTANRREPITRTTPTPPRSSV